MYLAIKLTEVGYKTEKCKHAFKRNAFHIHIHENLLTNVNLGVERRKGWGDGSVGFYPKGKLKLR